MKVVIVILVCKVSWVHFTLVSEDTLRMLKMVLLAAYIDSTSLSRTWPTRPTYSFLAADC